MLRAGFIAQNSYRVCARQRVALTGILLIVGFALVGLGQENQTSLPEKYQPTQVDRGKYIVENVAVCSQCHTPHDINGQMDRGKWLGGAPLWLQPTVPISDWPLVAPRLAGTTPGSDADMVKLLTTGIWRDGKYLRPPMPQFRMTKEDAESVVAYLRSLPSSHQ